MVGLETLEALELLGTLQLRIDSLDPLPHIAQMARLELRLVLSVLQPLAGKLSDRLQHPEAPLREAQQALLHERLQHIEVSAADFLGSFQRGSSWEDREADKELLLTRRQQVVGPLDSGAQRLLAGIAIGASLQEVEPLGEALPNLVGAEHARTCRRQLDRQR